MRVRGPGARRWGWWIPGGAMMPWGELAEKHERSRVWAGWREGQASVRREAARGDHGRDGESERRSVRRWHAWEACLAVIWGRRGRSPNPPVEGEPVRRGWGAGGVRRAMERREEERVGRVGGGSLNSAWNRVAERQ